MNIAINEGAENISLEMVNFLQEGIIDSSSPIDLYWNNVIELNRLLGRVDENSSLGMLILLGYISAVESYFRQLFCRIICFNPKSQEANIKQPISYGAALSLSDNPEQLAEVLLENTSFVESKTIKRSIEAFLGMSKNLPNELNLVVEEFEKICHLRHSAVHRFGFLGVNNAIKLFKVDNYNNGIGKRIKLNSSNLDAICDVCTNLVKLINNYLFSQMLIQRKEDWCWEFEEDKEGFRQIYDLFFSENFSGEEISIEVIYEDYRSKCGN